LDRDAPQRRAVHPPEQGHVVEIPEVGGLHHRYETRAASFRRAVAGPSTLRTCPDAAAALRPRFPQRNGPTTGGHKGRLGRLVLQHAGTARARPPCQNRPADIMAKHRWSDHSFNSECRLQEYQASRERELR
jgi:hypothetical protein